MKTSSQTFNVCFSTVMPCIFGSSILVFKVNLNDEPSAICQSYSGQAILNHFEFDFGDSQSRFESCSGDEDFVARFTLRDTLVIDKYVLNV